MARGDFLVGFNVLRPTARLGARDDFRLGKSQELRRCYLFSDTGRTLADTHPEVMPGTYANTGVTAVIRAAMSSGIAGALRWGLAFNNLQGANLKQANNYNFQLLEAPVPSEHGLLFEYEIPFLHGADMDGVVAGAAFELRLLRDAKNLAGGAFGCAEVFRVDLFATV